ncbi:hypothetical protein [Burkholderia ubonensis]|uniref:hypothetical protein n=1 Tax=Burkholderia ubonensis TaxID=101571 RepID=UPI000B0A01E6|nr:hypothetical protein [Burkholderia ubonensis]
MADREIRNRTVARPAHRIVKHVFKAETRQVSRDGFRFLLARIPHLGERRTDMALAITHLITDNLNHVHRTHPNIANTLKIQIHTIPKKIFREFIKFLTINPNPCQSTPPNLC